jgi:hypothetical protein
MKPSSGGKPPVGNTHLKKAAVLAAFKNCANVTKACELVDIARATFYGWLRDDPEFKAAYEASREEAIQVLEDEAVRRATVGGSDTLLIFLLKALRPQKYRDSYRAEIAAPHGAPLVPTKIEIVCAPPPQHSPGDQPLVPTRVEIVSVPREAESA